MNHLRVRSSKISNSNRLRTRQRAQPKSSHSGFSLMELLMVMALLVIMAALAAPLLNHSMSYQRLVKAGDIVRSEFARNRVRSIESGAEFVFRYQSGSNSFLSTLYSSTDHDFTPPSAYANDNPSFGRMYDYTDNKLPEGIVLLATVAEQTQRSQFIKEEIGKQSGPNEILFYPDGTTQSAVVYLRNELGDTIAVSLRGLTGVATVEPLTNANGGKSK